MNDATGYTQDADAAIDSSEGASPLTKLLRQASGVSIVALAKRCIKDREGEEEMEASVKEIERWLAKFDDKNSFLFAHVKGIQEVHG